jgi:aryl-alcohol dehydrogenase-like predicted oxidoreductase
MSTIIIYICGGRNEVCGSGGYRVIGQLILPWRHVDGTRWIADLFAVLDHFREAGGNFIDTANCYAWWLGHGEYVGDESEDVIGQWLRARKCRAEMVLATKVGARLRDPQGIRTGGGEPDWNRVRREYEGLSAAVIRRGDRWTACGGSAPTMSICTTPTSLTRPRHWRRRWAPSPT